MSTVMHLSSLGERGLNTFTEQDTHSCILIIGRAGSLTLTNRKSIRKAREGLFFLSNLSVIFCVT